MSDLASSLSILWPALIAGLLVMLSHVPLGQQVLRRGIVFIDLAIAQVAGFGVIAAHAFGMELEGWTTQAAAVIAALSGSLRMSNRSGDCSFSSRQEARNCATSALIRPGSFPSSRSR